MAKMFRANRSNPPRRSRGYVDMTFPQTSHGRILPMEEPGFFARIFSRQ